MLHGRHGLPLGTTSAAALACGNPADTLQARCLLKDRYQIRGLVEGTTPGIAHLVQDSSLAGHLDRAARRAVGNAEVCGHIGGIDHGLLDEKGGEAISGFLYPYTNGSGL